MSPHALARPDTAPTEVNGDPVVAAYPHQGEPFYTILVHRLGQYVVWTWDPAKHEAFEGDYYPYWTVDQPMAPGIIPAVTEARHRFLERCLRRGTWPREG